MRIGQRGTLTRIWARKGTRPRVVRQQQSESAYIFGAVCAQRDAAVGLVLPYDPASVSRTAGYAAFSMFSTSIGVR